MVRLQLSLADEIFILHLNGSQLIQLFHQQQAIAFDNPEPKLYEFDFQGQRIGLDTSKVHEKSLVIFVNQQQVSQLALPELQEAEPKRGIIGLLALGFKLFKSAKVVKAALAGASVAGYAWLFSIEFALMLIACLVVHEYGHVRAMKYFGIKTKGIYLIPFVGGLAVSDDKIT
ncbi:MAG: site-2 protease family protein, partial [Pseudomonadota bacterium]|nr:site-2 protease family protein [Pseudomonadota bacterium]